MGSDNGAKIMADIDASCIIANVYSGLICKDRYDSDPTDIDNKIGIRKLFIKSGLLINIDQYKDILQISELKN